MVGKRLKKACTTRWLFFDSSVQAIFEDYAAVLQTLSQLSEKETAAYGLLKRTKKRFLGTVYILKCILLPLSKLSKNFQAGNIDFSSIGLSIQYTIDTREEISKSKQPLDRVVHLSAKGKGCEDLKHWMKSICYHLWWCASNCGGDKDILEERWISIVNHTVKIHSFEGKFFKQCAHTPFEPEVSDTKQWLVKGSKAHKVLKEVVLDKRLRKDIRQLNNFVIKEI
ncbi:unnamed protein product [Mytilus coruscus]|uniref:Uncharacterized protein n=1 Tax=Mytilus coruscus TaxID=42192 RepID=A0A6J8BJV6_MYTCO|nr:unnamed protein product [Mytilus coruscus]